MNDATTYTGKHPTSLPVLWPIEKILISHKKGIPNCCGIWNIDYPSCSVLVEAGKMGGRLALVPRLPNISQWYCLCLGIHAQNWESVEYLIAIDLQKQLSFYQIPTTKTNLV